MSLEDIKRGKPPRRRSRHNRAAGQKIRRGDSGLRAGIFWNLTVFAARCFTLLMFKLRVLHRSRVPSRGAAILAVNHQSYLDPVLVGASVRRRCCFLARDSLFRVPVVGFLLRRLDALPLERERGFARQGIELSLKVLEMGRLLVLFPEGTRSSDGSLGPMRRGIGMIARRSGVPVVPVWIEGSFQAWPRGRRFPRASPVRVAFGEALWFDEQCDSDKDDDWLESFLERLRAAMELLSRECRHERGVDMPRKDILGREAE